MRRRITVLTSRYKEETMRLLALSLVAAVAFAQPNVRLRGAISAFDGKTLAVKDAGGKSFDILLVDKTKIVVPENASISTLVPGERSQLVPGAAVNLTMNEKREALRIQVSPAAVKPPK